MTETRAPFNGKKKELLLIQLPMSAENVMTVRKHIMSQCVTNDAIVNGIRAIGTPVTGSELDESIHVLVSAGIRKSLKDNWTTGVFALHAKADLLAQEVIAENPEVFAKFAERDAEIAKLREYYAANEDINRVGLFGATPEMFAREKKARAALKGPEA